MRNNFVDVNIAGNSPCNNLVVVVITPARRSMVKRPVSPQSTRLSLAVRLQKEATSPMLMGPSYPIHYKPSPAPRFTLEYSSDLQETETHASPPISRLGTPDDGWTFNPSASAYDRYTP